MLISLNWLKKYVQFSVSPEELAEKLTMSGLEVESIEYLGEKYDNFLVGEVLEAAKHPNADKLTVCKVNTGTETLQIVCGAPNVAAGQKIIIGLAGAVVPHNQHDPDGKPFQLGQVKIRGVESSGMICSAFELGLGDDKNGIMILDPAAKVGTPLADHLNQNDIVFSIGITPNRPDAMSHLGIAREVAALLDQKITLPKMILHDEENEDVSKYATIVIEDELNCPRYTARVVFDVKVKGSPAWLQNALNAVGIRPVNNVVDITNYVLMETGHPIHAFDYDKLSGHTIKVRCAQGGESFVTLDHKQRILRNDTLMICDDAKPVAIAGIMGGQDSEISSATRNILIESAYFNAQSIRKSSKYFGLSTDASQRFERGADPNMTEWAAHRVASLVHQLCSGEVLKGTIDVYPKRIQPKKVSLRLDRLNKVLGTTLDGERVSALLDKLQIKQLEPTRKGSGKMTMEFEIPTFRPDLDREIDLIEEVARVYGYDKIETKMKATIRFPEQSAPAMITDVLRWWLPGRGYDEALSNSLTDETTATLTSQSPVRVSNPISKDMAVLRTSLSMSMLQLVRNNLYSGNKDLRLFEIGKVYSKEENPSKPQYIQGLTEEERLCIAITGAANRQSWGGTTVRPVDLYDLKGELEAIFESISLDNFKFIPYTNTNPLTEYGLAIEIHGEKEGDFGKIRSSILKGFDIEQDVYIAELTLGKLQEAIIQNRKFVELPQYPRVFRDLAVTVEESLAVEELVETMRAKGGKLLKKIDLFDIYRGDQVAQGKKSWAFALEFQSKEKTLSQEEIDGVMDDIIRSIGSQFKAELRS